MLSEQATPQFSERGCMTTPDGFPSAAAQSSRLTFTKLTVAAFVAISTLFTGVLALTTIL